MNVLDTINKAIDLYTEAAELYEKIQPSIEGVTAPPSKGLIEAQLRLQTAMDRANIAHNSLEAAIAERLSG